MNLAIRTHSLPEDCQMIVAWLQAASIHYGKCIRLSITESG
jgi:hypothetical protein